MSDASRQGSALCASERAAAVRAVLAPTVTARISDIIVSKSN